MSRTGRPRKTRIDTEVAHVTRDSDTTARSKGQRSRSPGRFTHRDVCTSGSCSGGRGNVLAVGNCCYVAICSAAQGASAPTGEERGGSISWRPPAYSLFDARWTLFYERDGFVQMEAFCPVALCPDTVQTILVAHYGCMLGMRWRRFSDRHRHTMGWKIVFLNLDCLIFKAQNTSEYEI